MNSIPRTFITADGLRLKADSWGNPSHPAILFSHGGGQTRHSWGGTAQSLAELGWYTIAYDHRGHGDSEWSGDGQYGLDRFAADMKAIADSCNMPPALVGASLGGMSAMLCVGELDAAAFSSITLVDVTPSLNREGVNNIYQFMTEHMTEGFESLEHAAKVVADYTGRPQRDDHSGLEKNLRKRGSRWFWHWDPDFFSLRTDAQANPSRLIDAAKKITVPVQLIRGRMSDVVTQIQVDEFLQLVPHAEYVNVEKARHMVAGDRNDIFSAAVIDFISRQQRVA
jgi:pimeloyl-ACP methyl ester carboxylesterase